MHTPSPDPAFVIDVARRDDVVLVIASGELDLAADPVLGATLAQADALPVPVVADLSEVSFCGSCVLAQLVGAAIRKERAGLSLLVVTARSAVLRPLTLLGMDDYLTIVPDREAALEILNVSGATSTPPFPAPEAGYSRVSGQRMEALMNDKAENKVDELKGKAKEAVGNATDNEQWQAEGKAEQGKANLKQAGEKVKDAVKGVKD